MIKNNTFKVLSLIGLTTLILLALLIVFKLFVFSIPPESKDDGDDEYFAEMNRNYNIYTPKIPDTVFFAGEEVPIKNFDTYESLDYELLKVMFWHSESILYLKRKVETFAIVEPIMKKNGVPLDFKYLMIAESGMANVVSPAKAEGYWQFLKGTGIEYGLEINDEVDERYHLEKSTEAACKYLKDAQKYFGSWTLAAAAYNAGRQKVRSELDRQKVTSYYDLFLIKETARYVFRIIAYKIILSNPRDYGFEIRKNDFYRKPKTKVVQVDTAIPSLIDFAVMYNTTYKNLKELNPWLRSDKLTNPTGKTYYIEVPTDKGRKVY